MDPTLKKRIAKQLWYLCATQKNPWFAAAASRLEGYKERWDAWNLEQLEVTRELCSIVFSDAVPDDALLTRAIDFIERVT